MTAVLFSNPELTDNEMHLHVKTDTVIHTMKGGAGASWHAMIHDISLENEKYDYPVRHINPRGSAYGGNPPLEDTASWNQVFKHAGWLGLNFLRVELSMNMYEPERNVFDWKNDEMKALYRILDWCEANGADVFLQQMWGHVAWNSHPGVHPLLSSPRSLDDYAHGITTLLKYLTETRGYTCIKYFCMVNEPPGGPWGYWWSAGSHKGHTITDAWKKLNEIFRNEGITIPLSGPDWTSLPPLETDKLEFEKYLGALDIHSYNGIHNDEQSIETVADWVAFARSKNKPFFITEIGNMLLGWGNDNPGPKSFKAALSNASDIAICLNLGVDGFNRWSFTNRGNLDGQWQLIKTFDPVSNTYTSEVIPENEAYFGYAMITRFIGKYASVVLSESSQKPDGVFHAALKNRDGSIYVLIVNNRSESVQLNVTVEPEPVNQPLHMYQVTESLLKDSGFELNPAKEFRNSKKLQGIFLAPESITVITAPGLKHDERGRVE